jgi:hypothetical protein
MPPASAQSTLAPERDVDDEDDGSQVFVDPVFGASILCLHNELFSRVSSRPGTPLSLYVASDVENRENIADLISVRADIRSAHWMPIYSQSNGGIAAPGYSNVPYILGESMPIARARVFMKPDQWILAPSPGKPFSGSTCPRRTRSYSTRAGCMSVCVMASCRRCSTIGPDAK